MPIEKAICEPTEEEEEEEEEEDEVVENAPSSLAAIDTVHDALIKPLKAAVWTTIFPSFKTLLMVDKNERGKERSIKREFADTFERQIVPFRVTRCSTPKESMGAKVDSVEGWEEGGIEGRGDGRCEGFSVGASVTGGGQVTTMEMSSNSIDLSPVAAGSVIKVIDASRLKAPGGRAT